MTHGVVLAKHSAMSNPALVMSFFNHFKTTCIMKSIQFYPLRTLFILLLCSVFITTTYAQDEEPYVDGEDADLLLTKKKKKCDETGFLSFRADAFCADPGLTLDEAIDQYENQHLVEEIGERAECVIDCSGDKVCELYFHSHRNGSETPEPDPDHPGCEGFYFPSVYVKIKYGCNACHNPFTKEPGVASAFTEEEHDHSIGESRLLEIIPNPANDRFDLRFELDQPMSSATMQIMNMSGQLVSSEYLGHLPHGQYRHEFNAIDLSAGIYLINLSGAEQQLNPIKLVIQH